jgi:DNA-binding NtrC family response regulator
MKRHNPTQMQVLLVDDEEQILGLSKLHLKLNGIKEVLTLSDSREVLPLLASQPVAVLVLDLSMPHVTGLELLEEVKRDYTHISIVVVTALNEADVAVNCMKLGAFDYLVKPVNFERLVAVVMKALEIGTLSRELSALKHHLLTDSLDHPEAFAPIVTSDKKMRALFQYMEVVAGSRQPILITGETGVGKELVAQAIHTLSGCKGAFIAINVAGLDDHMFSDVLFGHKKGSFTGADQVREGIIARAAGGTLFLDEIGDLNEMSQLKLLRLLQEREYYPVGSDQTRKSDAHIVLATNCDLKERIAAGKFRNDLYYRLCGHQVQVPPLRERKADLPQLLDHLIREEAKKLNIAPPSYPTELIQLLETYHFPGNVRELQGMVSDAVPRNKSKMLSLESFRQAMSANGVQCPSLMHGSKDEDTTLRNLDLIWGHFPTLNEAQDLLIDTALQVAKGNQGIAANMLGLKRQTLNMRLKVKKESD